MLVMDRASRTSQIVNLIHFHVERKGYVVAHKLKIGLVKQMGHVVACACVKVINTEHVIPTLHQTVAKV